MSAQRFPEDFDAIVAGAPANYHSHLHSNDLVNAVPALTTPGGLAAAAKLTMLNQAVLNACDAKDGVKDGLLNNPHACKFDAASLVCKGEDSSSCLTPVQLESVKRMYAPSKFRDGKAIFPGKTIGSEASWTAIVDTSTQPIFVALGSFQLAYQDPNWDWKKLDIDRDVKVVDEKTGFINAIDPDLEQVQGARRQDPDVPRLERHGDFAAEQHRLLQSVLAKMGGSQSDFIRLFMAPGMAHCQGGPGPGSGQLHGRTRALARRRRTAGDVDGHADGWQSCGHDPPTCPYPQVATYKGSGSTNDAASFVCK